MRVLGKKLLLVELIELFEVFIKNLMGTQAPT